MKEPRDRTGRSSVEISFYHETPEHISALSYFQLSSTHAVKKFDCNNLHLFIFHLDQIRLLFQISTF